MPEQSISESINQAIMPFADGMSAVIFYSINIFGNDVPLVLIGLFSAAVFFTLSLRFINLRGFTHSIKILRDPDEDVGEGDVSHFQALTSALSGTVGIGNLASVPVAIAIGGPGALFWMIVMGFFSMTTKFVECYMSVKYRRESPNGEVSGGPMYYIEHAFNKINLPKMGKFWAIFFAVSSVGGSMTIFPVSQAYVQFSFTTGIDAPLIFGVVFSAIVGVAIIGGIKTIGRVTEIVVPWMCGLYLLAGVVILVINASVLPSALASIIKGAFGMDAAAGGFIGALINGVRRAAYSSEAGFGSAAFAHSAARTKKPISQGYVALLEPFIDTVVVATMTGLVVVVTGVYTQDLQGIEITSAAFGSVISWYPTLLVVAAILFAYSTCIAWAYYGERAAIYLFGDSKKVINSYKAFLLVVIATASSIHISVAINIVDSFLFAMAIPNILALYLLSSEIRQDVREYEMETFK
ncbi:alanine/glycine:cation symporter family protein [Agarilytica rhodophyticola]|uniref:alanine/glycine:cation symporter family protein n=1 Tax=Agarilytica rhodophyticola TaxID=1737490 RepID=UPI001C1FFEAB|nr:alanine/glycine:cation symporter family protein [Agarilytica rhodophyticola]